MLFEPAVEQMQVQYILHTMEFLLLLLGFLQDIFTAIMDTVQDVIAAGGRYDETDLFGKPGGYVRLMDSHTAGKPCPECGHMVEKIQYLGGACYFCPSCQV